MPSILCFVFLNRKVLLFSSFMVDILFPSFSSLYSSSEDMELTSYTGISCLWHFSSKLQAQLCITQ